MTGFAKLALSVQKVRAAIHNRRKAGAKDQRGSSLRNNHADLPLSSPWDLPVEIQIRIFAYSGITDFHPLRLVCKAFYQLLTRNEHEIVRQYLRLRRHGTLPSPIDDDRTYTRNPGDDVVLLSDLFPPSKSARGGHLYTFKYLHGLRRRQTLCSRLCYYLADRILDRFIQTEPAVMKASFPAKGNERNALVKRGIASIWFHLAPLMYYTLYFLESYASARREHTNMLVQKYEAGQLPVPLPLEIRQRMYRELQTRILQSPPFTNTATLVATHHCMHLLVSYIRYAMSLDGQAEIDDSWISSLLTLAPFVRIVEFFSAEIGDGGSQRTQRKDFMYNFYNDTTKYEKDHMNSVVFARASAQNLHSSVQDIWFAAAAAELRARRAIPHDVEHVWVWNGIPIVFGCPDCHPTRGWQA
ncbi:Cyclin-like F-box [Penicillium camemberti]|uniref:Cyclin-like F-box n=1 Tax=Penicillium camemberti (strain FM 013) TaxID=1429867 RepID=A0A0G4P7W4_PENC3|nr:Cyclin-like F-box [Penicillium camemberti]